MKNVLKSLFISAFLASFPLVNAVVAAPIPLQPGVYYGGGSRYISIAKKGKQYCYIGSSNYGLGYASIRLVPKYPNVYKLAGSPDSFVAQKSRESISFGDLKHVINNNLSGGYRLDSMGDNSANSQNNVSDNELSNNPYLRQCFNNRKPFSIHIPNR
ncbi:hypothetical protein [Anabaena sp. CCY 9402-a]|uniref:hypothetical protein n=1 Tax=Anabaena sp. CCY 9402-a TaxID=3103867 RepID=UPI0039C6BEEE